ncbi:MAG: glycosyltransferase [Bacteroidetes bacterium]|nr:glycosyltransferase [Bacteroidota bacterium]
MKEIVSISIIAANYNNGKYLPEFIESIIHSTVLPLELIIIDDGSTDKSLEILEAYKEIEFLKLIKFEKNSGNPTAVNAGLEIAKGKYIMRADPDDKLLPERIEKQFQYMETHHQIDILGSNVLYFNDCNNDIINASNLPLTDNEIKKTYRKGEHGLLQATTILKAEVFKQYRYKNIFPAEDYELFSRMVKDGRYFYNMAEPLYLVRVHSGSSTTNLKIETIRQTFAFRDEIFGYKTSNWWIYMYFQYISHYRSYQMTENTLLKYSHLLLSVMFYPAKLFKRLKNILF